jgi:hypothetical protein
MPLDPNSLKFDLQFAKCILHATSSMKLGQAYAATSFVKEFAKLRSGWKTESRARSRNGGEQFL